MTLRKKKILFLQITLLFLAILIVFQTYANKDVNKTEKILSEKAKLEINKKIKNDKSSGNVFYNIVYSGLDLSGNRYMIKAKEASNSNNDDGIVNLKTVSAVFYFDDNKNLTIDSTFGIYNNKTLDMKFEENIIANYDNSTLKAEKAEYLNSKNYIEISENVKIDDYRGTILAERLVFDIEKKKLNITSSDTDKVKANLNYK